MLDSIEFISMLSCHSMQIEPTTSPNTLKLSKTTPTLLAASTTDIFRPNPICERLALPNRYLIRRTALRVLARILDGYSANKTLAANPTYHARRGKEKRTAAAWVIGWTAIHPDNGRGAGGASGYDAVGGVFRGGEVLAGIVVVAAEGG